MINNIFLLHFILYWQIPIFVCKMFMFVLKLLLLIFFYYFINISKDKYKIQFKIYKLNTIKCLLPKAYGGD